MNREPVNTQNTVMSMGTQETHQGYASRYSEPREREPSQVRPSSKHATGGAASRIKPKELLMQQATTDSRRNHSIGIGLQKEVAQTVDYTKSS